LLKNKLLACFLVITIFAVPLVIYYFLIGRADSLSVDKAQQLISVPDTSVILVDVRSENDFRLRHINESVNLPFESIEKIKDSAGLPGVFRNRKLLLICNSGIQSAIAAIKNETPRRRAAGYLCPLKEG